MAIPRTFSNILNPGHSTPTFDYIWDSTILTTGGNQVVTGAFRAFTTSDISSTSVSVSGLNLSVGSVNLTGDNPVRVANTNAIAFSGAIQGGNLIPLYVTGSVISVVTGLVVSSSSSTAITGNPGVVVTGGQLSGSALGSLDLSHTYLPVSGLNFSASVSVNAVAITGFNSGSALGFLDITKTYLPVSGVNTLNVNNVGGFLGLTGSTSGNGLGNLDLTRTFLPVSGAGGGFISITTGTLTATIAAGTSVAVTGGNINVTDNLGWALLSGISGLLTTNLSGSAPITGDIRNIPGTVLAISGVVNATLQATSVAVTGGQIISIDTGNRSVSIVNTAPIAISGVVLTVVTGTVSSTISNPIGVSGVAIDRALPSVGGFATQFLPIGGRVMNASGVGSITGYNTTGDLSMLTISKDNGGLFVNQGVLDQTQDNVTTWPASSGATASAMVSGGAVPLGAGLILPNNPNRRSWFLQNLGTGVLMARYSATPPTTGTANIFLKGGTAVNDGLGASWSDDMGRYTGPVSVSGVVPSINTLFTVWEL